MSKTLTVLLSILLLVISTMTIVAQDEDPEIELRYIDVDLIGVTLDSLDLTGVSFGTRQTYFDGLDLDSRQVTSYQHAYMQDGTCSVPGLELLFDMSSYREGEADTVNVFLVKRGVTSYKLSTLAIACIKNIDAIPGDNIAAIPLTIGSGRQLLLPNGNPFITIDAAGILTEVSDFISNPGWLNWERQEHDHVLSYFAMPEESVENQEYTFACIDNGNGGFFNIEVTAPGEGDDHVCNADIPEYAVTGIIVIGEEDPLSGIITPQTFLVMDRNDQGRDYLLIHESQFVEIVQSNDLSVEIETAREAADARLTELNGD